MSEALPASPTAKKTPKGPRLSALPEAGCILCRLSFVVVGLGAKAFTKSVLDSDMAKEMAASAVDDIGGGGRRSEGAADVDDITLEDEASVGNHRSMKSMASAMSKTSTLVCSDEGGIVVTLDSESQTMGRINVSIVEDFSDSIPRVKDASDVRNTCFFLLADSRQDLNSDVLPPLQRVVAEANFAHTAVTRASSGDEPSPALRIVIFAHEDGAECVVADPDEPMQAFYDKVLEMSGDSGLSCLHYKVDFDNPEFIYSCFEEVASQMYQNMTQRKERSTVRSPHLPPKKTEDSKAGQKCCCALQ